MKNCFAVWFPRPCTTRLAAHRLLDLRLNRLFCRPAEDFLAAQSPDAPACVIMDVRLKGQSGLVLQQRLTASHKHLPVIFMTAHGDIEMSVKAMKRGAFDFFAKPFREQDLLDSVSEALENSSRQQERNRALKRLSLCYQSLTPRERDVMALIVGGRRNKDIAEQLGLSEATIKVHRTQAMKKWSRPQLPNLSSRPASWALIHL